MWLNPLPCEQQPVVSALEKLQGNLTNSEDLKIVAFNKNYWTWDRVSKREFTKSNTFFFFLTTRQCNRLTGGAPCVILKRHAKLEKGVNILKVVQMNANCGVSVSLCSPNRSIECCMEVLRRSLLCWNINETYANARVQQPPATPISSISCCQCFTSTNAALDCQLWEIRSLLICRRGTPVKNGQWNFRNLENVHILHKVVFGIVCSTICE